MSDTARSSSAVAEQAAPDLSRYGITIEHITELRSWWDAESKPSVDSAERALYAQAFTDGFAHAHEGQLSDAARWVAASQGLVGELGLVPTQSSVGSIGPVAAAPPIGSTVLVKAEVVKVDGERCLLDFGDREPEWVDRAVLDAVRVDA